jgi:hypothetical protein
MKLHVTVPPQPDDESCGITCLQAIYQYYGLEIPLETLKQEVVHWQSGGTVSVNLGRNALVRGFAAEIYTYNIKVFDPTWRELPKDELLVKLKLRQKRIRSNRQKKQIGFYLDFLCKGGSIRLDDLDESLMKRLFAAHHPVICGLSATYLYQAMRELPDNLENDVTGHPVGHFVVVSGYNADTREVEIHDPLRRHALSATGMYSLPFHKFSNAVMLGILTYDANLLVISKT